MNVIARRTFATTTKLNLNSNVKKSLLEPTYKNFAQYRLKTSQRDPLFNKTKTRMLLNKKPIVQIEIKDDYYSFDNKFKKIARAIEYKS